MTLNTTIWKFGLDARENQTIRMPAGADVLYAAEQFGDIVIYAHVDPHATTFVDRHVWIFGNGATTKFSRAAKSLGVVALRSGSLTFHVFVEPEPEPHSPIA